MPRKQFQTYEEVLIESSESWLARLNGKSATVMAYRKNGKEWEVRVEVNGFTETQVTVPESSLRAMV